MPVIAVLIGGLNPVTWSLKLNRIHIFVITRQFFWQNRLPEAGSPKDLWSIYIQKHFIYPIALATNNLISIKNQ